MSADLLDRAAVEVLERYPRLLWSGSPQPLGNRGGFSGARLWRLDGPAGPLCLRSWPTSMSSSRLDFIHHYAIHARAAGLAFVPRLFPSSGGATYVLHAGRLWELQEWLSGISDYLHRPSPAKLRAACIALAELHACWQAAAPKDAGPCPAVRRRLDAVREWRELIASGWRPLSQAAAADPARSAAERAWRVLPYWIETIPDLLKPWADRTWPLQPCLCDVWRDHVLFDGDRVSGLVDFGAVKTDHPAVDVARLLGSFIGEDAEGWATGLTAYREVHPFTAEEEGLARALDVSGTVIGAATWLRWLYHEGREFEDRAAAGQRLEKLATRIESHRTAVH